MCPAALWSPLVATTPIACPGGRAVWGLHQLPAAWHRLHHPVLPAPITTASYSCCSCFVAPAWASRTAGSPRDRCQPHSQWDRQPVPSLAQSTAAIAPQCLATAVLCPAAWTLLSQQNFSQCFWAWGGDRGPGQAMPWHRATRCVPGLVGRLSRTMAQAQCCPPSTACSKALSPGRA